MRPATAFSRSLRELRGDSFRPAALTLVAALCFAGAWCVLGKITLYEVTDTARLEVSRAVYPVQANMAGRVITASLAIGHDVKEGDVLVEQICVVVFAQIALHEMPIHQFPVRAIAGGEVFSGRNQRRGCHLRFIIADSITERYFETRSNTTPCEGTCAVKLSAAPVRSL